MAEKRQKNRFPVMTLLIPIAAFLVLVVIVLSFSKGRSIDESSLETPLLSKPANQSNDAAAARGVLDSVSPYYLYSGEKEESSTIILFDGESDDSEIMAKAVGNALDTLRLDYRYEDITGDDVNWQNCEMLLLCFPDLDRFGTQQFYDFIFWLEHGDLIWCSGFENNTRFKIIYRLLGITSCSSGSMIDSESYTFVDDILPGLEGKVLDPEDLSDSFWPVQLQEECTVHIEDSATGIPMLWTFRGDENTVSVFNSSMFRGKNILNGMMNHIVAKHRDITLWPVTNSALVYIDDFPAPQPEGFDERLREQFGYSTQSFFMNVWWPDMKDVADRFGLLYTGVFVETYNDDMVPPYEKGTAGSLLRYYSSELVSEGGEISLHGYNHQALIPEGYPNTDDYKGWPSQENMYLASVELREYAHDLLPELTFTSYVPPSNYLSEEGYEALTTAIPQLRIISGLYYDGDEGTSYFGNFMEKEDGIIDVPRITSGYSPNNFDILRMYNSLFDLGIFSHFIHPDDVLDIERGALLGWNKLYSDFNDMFEDVFSTYPQLRTMTATPGGGAVQRSQRLIPSYSKESISDGTEKISVRLEGFVDVAWLGLCTDEEILSVEGGEAFRIGSDYWWLRADCDEMTIIRGERI